MQKDLKVLWNLVFESTPFKVQLLAYIIILSIQITCYIF